MLLFKKKRSKLHTFPAMVYEGVLILASSIQKPGVGTASDKDFSYLCN